MQRQPIPYEKCLFICENVRTEGRTCCGPRVEGLRDRLKAYCKDHGLQRRVRIASSGCLDRCGQGPNCFVYPDGLWYSTITPEDVEQLIAEQLAPLTQ